MVQVALDNIFLSKTAFIIYGVLVSIPFVCAIYSKMEDKYNEWQNRKILQCIKNKKEKNN